MPLLPTLVTDHVLVDLVRLPCLRLACSVELLSRAPRVYKGKVERSTCGFELMRFIPTRLCQYRAKTRIQNTDIMDWAAVMKPASTHILPAHSHETIYHVMPREKRCGALDSCFGPHQQSIPHNFSLWHHEFIKAKLSAALVVLN